MFNNLYTWMYYLKVYYEYRGTRGRDLLLNWNLLSNSKCLFAIAVQTSVPVLENELYETQELKGECSNCGLWS